MLALESPSCWMAVKAVVSFAYHAKLVPANVRKAGKLVLLVLLASVM